MLTILIGMAVNLFTYLMKKFKLSSTYLSIILSVIWWCVYFYFTEFNQAGLETVIYYITWIYTTSQIVYNVIAKIKKENLPTK